MSPRRHRSIPLALMLAASVSCGDDRLADGDGDAAGPGPSAPRSPVALPGQPNPDGSISVRHERELRGAWISTVYNGTWPSKPGLAPDAAKSELSAILDALASARMNVVFFQVRAESDAVYASRIEPWSRFLTGNQGQDPGWDPLVFAVDEGHRRGLEVHAWLNPYRALVDAKTEAAPSHVTKTLSAATRAFGTQIWMDPGVPEVRTHVMNVVRDILQRYDVDGIHFDDYFYPYPIAGQSFDDGATFAAYMGGGGTLAKDDWRRSNVDALVRETADVVAQTRSDVRFGVSPFGIYRPGTPTGITGLDAYATLYCDPVRWMNEGWVDYLAPQLYWPTTQTAQAFGKLVDWWASVARDGRSIFVGHDATKAGQGRYSLDEYDAQMTLTYDQRERGVRGSIFFSAKPLATDQANLRTTLATKHWMLPAAPPPIAGPRPTPTPEADVGAPPTVTWEGGELALRLANTVRSVVFYRETGLGVEPPMFTVERIAPTIDGTVRTRLERGRWAITTVDRRGFESRGTLVSAD